jgi:transposase
MEQVLMNRKERERLVVFSRVKDKELGRREAAAVLGLSLRQVHRIYRRYLAQGDVGLTHRARGRASPLRFAAADRERALALYRDCYRGFGPTLLAEKLGPAHGLWVSHDTLRRWLISEGLFERPRKGRRSRRRRLRRERFGQMIQMDGSLHRWFEERGPKAVLMVIVDDATGRMDGRFYPGETMAAAMDLFGRWCGRHGVPQSLYVDRAGIYRAEREASVEEIRVRRKPLTQFGRAMRELDVRLILANSPQAKGRVERANGTLQDRLVKELRLARASSIEAANAFLDRDKFFETLSGKFAVTPADAADAHRPLVMSLRDVLCVKDKRSVGNDGCVQWQGRVLQLRDHRIGLRAVEVWQQADGALDLLDGGRRLTWEPAAAPGKKVRPPIQNNKRHKPGPKQQISLKATGKPRQPEPTRALRPTG